MSVLIRLFSTVSRTEQISRPDWLALQLFCFGKTMSRPEKQFSPVFSRNGSPLFGPSFLRPFVRTRLSAVFAAILLAAVPGISFSVQTVNNGDMNITFGDGSDNLDLLNNGTIRAYGSGMEAGAHSRLENAGTVTVLGGNAYGMIAGDGATLTNQATGIINVSQSDGHGMALTGNTGNITNNGAINLNGRYGVGLFARDTGDVAESVTLTNNGTIHGATASDVGMAAEGKGIALVNSASGIILMDGHDNGGIVASGDDSTVINNGAITVSGYGSKGIAAFGNHSVLANNGDIIVTGYGSNAIEAGNHVSVIQTGNIRVTGTDGTGVLLESGASLDNSGSIITTQSGSHAIYGFGDDISITNTHTLQTGGENAIGIALSGEKIHILNRGQITTTGQYGEGISISGDGSTVSNAGSITTSGKEAHGIFITGGNVTVSNTGRITVTGPGSHELMVGNSDGSVTGHVFVNTWSLALSPGQWNDPASRPFAVGPGSTLTFSGTRLILRPGNTASGFEFGKRYDVADMIDNAGGSVTGSIGSDTPDSTIAGAMPMLRANLYGGSADGALNQQVSLSLDENGNHGQGANNGSVHRTAARLWLLERTLGDSFDTLVAAPDWSFFVQPYYQHSRVTGNARSKSDSEGLIAGATRPIGDNLRLGWHAGLEHTDLAASRHGLKSDTNAWQAGLHGKYSLTPCWALHGQITGTVARSNYDFSMEGDAASDKRTEYGIFTRLKSSWDIPVTARHTLSPEIGLAWLWMRNPAMNAHWKQEHNQEMNLHFEKRDFSAIYGTADLRWRGKYPSGDTVIRPTVALGVRQNLLDGHVESGFTFMGNRYTSYLDEDRTTGTADIGVRITRNNLSGTLRYNGKYGNHFTSHIIWAEFGATF